MVEKTVLVVDDDLMVRDMLYDFLLERGYRVIAAEDGKSALESIRNRTFQAAIVDIKLPEANGLSIVRRMKEVKPDVPVIVVTAYPSEEVKAEAYAIGAVAFMEKPFKVTRIAAELKKAMPGQESIDIRRMHVI